MRYLDRFLIAPLGAVLLTLGLATTARAQSAPSLQPAVSSPAPPATGMTREAQLEARIRQLEEMANQLSGQVNRLSTRPAAGASGGSANPPAGAPGSSGNVGPIVGGSGSGLQPSTPPVTPNFQMPAANPKLPMKVIFGPGFQLSTEDDEFQFQFHNLTQIDYRGYQQGGQSPVHDTFALPREWLIFSGRLTKPFEYYASIAEGFDTLNALDVFLNIHYDDRLQFRAGRFIAPSQYELYALPVFGLLTPEFSLYFNNFGLNRDLGMMTWGQLFEKKADYAVGIFNGTRNGFLDNNDGKDLVSYVNVRPFAFFDLPALEYLNIGGSIDYGNQLNSPIPQTLRTAVPTTGNSIAGVPFLAFNDNVRESGDRALWTLHASYFYRHLSLIAEWESGFQDYALANALANRVHLPVESYYVQAGYFLTGETVTSRGTLKPLRPFDLRKGKFGTGALELVGRFNSLDVGRQVFTSGLADPNLWTNHLHMVDVGLNWYLTQNIKVYFDWEHAEFGDPVQFAPGRLQKTSDLFWVRFQIFF